MTYEQLKDLKPEEFKRLCGIHFATIERMVEVLRPHLERTGKRGGQPKLSVEDQLLITLEKGAGVPDILPHWHSFGASMNPLFAELSRK